MNLIVFFFLHTFSSFVKIADDSKNEKKKQNGNAKKKNVFLHFEQSRRLLNFSEYCVRVSVRVQG